MITGLKRITYPFGDNDADVKYLAIPLFRSLKNLSHK